MEKPLTQEEYDKFKKINEENIIKFRRNNESKKRNTNKKSSN